MKKIGIKYWGRGSIIDDFTIISNEITNIIGIILKGRKWRFHQVKNILPCVKVCSARGQKVMSGKACLKFWG